MRSQEDAYYQAVLARDPRFDGKFFVGVKTTGIYCRPICPAKPRRENVEFFPDARAAEKAGYRPCLRCRPESAPLSPVWQGRSATVQRALKLISSSVPLEVDEERFAESLGVSARHLRRLFSLELGKTPKQILDANRLNFSRKLVVETRIPITEIAFMSGFASIRRFNDAFKTRFHRAPSELRRDSGTPVGESSLRLMLPYRPPLDWNALVGFFRAHEIAGVESVSECEYRRIFKLDGKVGGLTVFHSIEGSQLVLDVHVSSAKPLFSVVQRIRQMFDLDSDPLLIGSAFSGCGPLFALAEKHAGLRVPRGWDPYEVVITTILGQLVSIEQARLLTGQLVEHYGESVMNPLNGKNVRLFPVPEILAREALSHLGTTQARRSAIQEVSRRVLDGRLRLDPAQDPKLFREALLQIKGVGPWSAEYISMRALGDADAFPVSDLILKRALENNPGISVENCRPWRAYAAMVLWKEFASQLSRKRRRNT